RRNGFAKPPVHGVADHADDFQDRLVGACRKSPKRVTDRIGVQESFPCAEASVRIASRCGSLTGSARRTRLLTSEKIAVFAPIPSASDRMATVVTTGVPISCRTATRRSWRYPPYLARGRLDSSRNDAAFSASSAI